MVIYTLGALLTFSATSAATIGSTFLAVARCLTKAFPSLTFVLARALPANPTAAVYAAVFSFTVWNALAGTLLALLPGITIAAAASAAIRPTFLPGAVRLANRFALSFFTQWGSIRADTTNPSAAIGSAFPASAVCLAWLDAKSVLAQRGIGWTVTAIPTAAICPTGLACAKWFTDRLFALAVLAAIVALLVIAPLGSGRITFDYVRPVALLGFGSAGSLVARVAGRASAATPDGHGQQ